MCWSFPVYFLDVFSLSPIYVLVITLFLGYLLYIICSSTQQVLLLLELLAIYSAIHILYYYYYKYLLCLSFMFPFTYSKNTFVFVHTYVLCVCVYVCV